MRRHLGELHLVRWGVITALVATGIGASDGTAAHSGSGFHVSEPDPIVVRVGRNSEGTWIVVKATDKSENLDLSATVNPETGARALLLSVSGDGGIPPTLRVRHPMCETTEPGNVLCSTQVRIVFGLRGGDDRFHVSAPTWEKLPGDDEPPHISGEVYGGSGADRITAGASLGWIRGGAGGDTLSGSLSSNEIFGGSGYDVITGNEAHGGVGDDEIRGTGSADGLFGEAGHDVIHARAGNDLIGGGLGNDRLLLQTGQDTVYPSRGDDRIHSDDGKRDIVNCGRGRDSVDRDGADRLYLCEAAT